MFKYNTHIINPILSEKTALKFWNPKKNFVFYSIVSFNPIWPGEEGGHVAPPIVFFCDNSKRKLKFSGFSN